MAQTGSGCARAVRWRARQCPHCLQLRRRPRRRRPPHRPLSTATLSTTLATATLATALVLSARTAPITARLLDASLRREHPLMALVEDDVGGLVEALEHAHDVAAVVGHDLYYLVHHAIQHGRHRCEAGGPLRGASAAARPRVVVLRDTAMRTVTCQAPWRR